jgi:hypothetical protein
LIFITGILVVFDSTPQVLEIEPQAYAETFFFTSGLEHFSFNN